VTSVAIAREFIPGTSTGWGAIGCGLLLLFFGGLGLLGSLLALTDNTASRGDDVPTVAAMASVFVVAGAFGIYIGRSQHKASQNAFHFVVRMRSASGEQQVYVSRDEAHVRRIVAALTAAIST
jgi:hypothetical protein